MTRKTKLLFALPISLILCACATNTRYIVEDFGEAHNAVLAKQIVTTAATPGAPVQHPKKANDAVGRYLDDTIKKPKESKEIQTEVD